MSILPIPVARTIPIRCSASKSSDPIRARLDLPRGSCHEDRLPPSLVDYSNALGARLGAALAAIVLATTPLYNCPSAISVTNEQLLFLEAWRAVDRAYVDKGFNGQTWFRVREDALKTVKMTSREETYAAIKQLLTSLGDPFTRFLEPDQYAALKYVFI